MTKNNLTRKIEKEQKIKIKIKYAEKWIYGKSDKPDKQKQ